MGDPSFSSEERVLIRTPGILVKSIPFEGTLTNRRIILTDREKNILPSKDIPLATIQRVGSGVNALQDPLLNISVIPRPGETRQMVLTFSRQEGGDRVRERDEWARLIQDYLSRSSAPVSRPSPAPAPAAQPRYEVVNTPVPPARDSAPGSAVPPAPVRVAHPSSQPVPPSGETVFCTRCGNRVAVDSMFCNRCGTPIVPPAGVKKAAPQQPPRPAAAPVAPAPVSTPPAPVARAPEPVYQPPAPVQAPPRYEESAPAVRQPASPVQAAKPAPQKAAKKGFLAGIFGSKGSKPAAARPQRPAPSSERGPRKSRMPGKKVILGAVVILVIIAVVAAGVFVVLPNLSSVLPSGGSSSSGSSSSGGSSGSSVPLSNTGVASVTVKETTAVPVPVTSVWVKVDYIGSYRGTYGMPSALLNLAESGSRLFEVANANGTVQALVEKTDSSTKHELTVTIYKDGKVLKSGKTSVSYGNVKISADVGGSTEAAASEPAAEAVIGNETTDSLTPLPSETATSTPEGT